MVLLLIVENTNAPQHTVDCNRSIDKRENFTGSVIFLIYRAWRTIMLLADPHWCSTGCPTHEQWAHSIAHQSATERGIISFDMNPFLNSALITYPAFVEGREAEVLALSAALRRNWLYVIRRMVSVPIEGGR
jgi:hypothetical protein